MTAFDERFQSRGVPSLLDRFGESIVYKPRNGRPRTITAMVTRNPPSELSEIDGGVATVLIIEVENDEQGGIASHLWSRGDQVTVAVRVGADPETRTIEDILPDHGATCEFRVR